MGLLFQKRFHAGLIDGTVNLTFRAWSKPQVKPGGRYRCHPIGVLEADAIDTVTVGQITEEDAKASGFEGRAELVEYLKLAPDATVYRVKLHYVGDVDAKPEAFAVPSDEEVAKIEARLDRLDDASPHGAWTRMVLGLIREHPHRRAGDLADFAKREKLEFKEDVRKLKRLGLTISHEIGYSLSPRGETILKKKKRKR